MTDEIKTPSNSIARECHAHDTDYRGDLFHLAATEIERLERELALVTQERDALRKKLEESDEQTLDSICRFLPNDKTLTWREVLAGYDHAAPSPPATAKDGMSERENSLLEALKGVQWSYSGIHCPECGNTKRQGHEDFCPIGQALAAYEPGGKEKA